MTTLLKTAIKKTAARLWRCTPLEIDYAVFTRNDEVYVVVEGPDHDLGVAHVTKERAELEALRRLTRKLCVQTRASLKLLTELQEVTVTRAVRVAMQDGGPLVPRYEYEQLTHAANNLPEPFRLKETE